ncbi:MAG: MMPL family transporter [Candidatus Hatepunaea meridiana]|nr:MMPL family transporter [Candidatus Hatepunaea meridiana]
METFRSVGKAISMTSMVIVLGFSVFLTSDANAYRHLGFYMGIAVFTALAADYFVTPVLIMLTKPFKRN